MSAALVGDLAAFRVAGDFRYSRTSSKLEDVIEGGDPSHDVYGLLRAKLLVNPAPLTRMVLTYVHSESQMPQTVGVDAPFDKRRDDSAEYGVFRINVDSLTAGIRHEASDDLTANLMLTAGNSKARRLAIRDFGQTRNDGRDWSAEAVFNWSPDGTAAAGRRAHRTPSRAQAIHQPSTAVGLDRPLPRLAGRDGICSRTRPKAFAQGHHERGRAVSARSSEEGGRTDCRPPSWYRSTSSVCSRLGCRR